MMDKAQNLDEAIKLSGIKKNHLATKVGLSRQTFYSRLKDPSLFTIKQANILCNELNINTEKERNRLFFLS